MDEQHTLTVHLQPRAQAVGTSGVLKISTNSVVFHLPNVSSNMWGLCLISHTLSLSSLPSFLSLPPSLHVSVLHSFEYPLYLNAVNISSNQQIKSQTINKIGRDFKPTLKIQIVRQLFYVYNTPGALGSSLWRTVHEKAMLHLDYST